MAMIQFDAAQITKNLTTIRDCGYRAAHARDGAINVARWAADNIPGFPDNIDDAARGEFLSGAYLRKGELEGEVWFKVEKVMDAPPTYTRCAPPKDTKAEGYMKVDVAFALGYTSQAFGALRRENPNLHPIIKDIRDRANKYASNVLSSVIRAYKSTLPSTKERSPNKSFAEFIDAQMKAIEDKVKAAHKRKDADAPPMANIMAAIAAFNRSLNGK